MKKQQRLSDEQEQVRLEGLRILARMIARHHLAHPEFYPEAASSPEEAVARRDSDGGEALAEKEEQI